MTDNGDLTALVGSRICHDLVSPLGAIGNGLELMLLSGAEETPELTLVNEALAGAHARIRFFRLAFGAARDGTLVCAGDVREALAALGGPKLAISWEVREELPRAEARRVLLAITCLEAAMPFGGRITVTESDAGWSVSGESERFIIDEADWAFFGPERPAALPDPSKVQFALLAQDGKDTGHAPTVTTSDTDIILRV